VEVDPRVLEFRLRKICKEDGQKPPKHKVTKWISTVDLGEDRTVSSFRWLEYFEIGNREKRRELPSKVPNHEV
jgi:hypothetical protein